MLPPALRHPETRSLTVLHLIVQSRRTVTPSTCHPGPQFHVAQSVRNIAPELGSQGEKSCPVCQQDIHRPQLALSDPLTSHIHCKSGEGGRERETACERGSTKHKVKRVREIYLEREKGRWGKWQASEREGEGRSKGKKERSCFRGVNSMLG